MDFRVLGPLEVERAGETLQLPGGKPTALLLLLLIRRNTSVSVDEILDQLWGGAPPRSGRNLVQVHVWHIRRAFAALKVADRVETTGPGYRLLVRKGELDLEIFEDLIRRARSSSADGNHSMASELIDEALALWRGPPLIDVGYEDYAISEVARLEELRLQAIEERFDSLLAMGRHRTLISDLEAMVTEHPLRETIRIQLMKALARSDRPIDALRVARDWRRIVRAELGAEPGSEFATLEESLLLGDLSPTTSAPIEPVVVPVVSGDAVIQTLLAFDEPKDSSTAFDEMVHEAGGRFVDARPGKRLAIMSEPSAALEALRQLRGIGLASTESPRMAAHAGPAKRVGDSYVGPGVNRCYALLSASGPAQPLVSGSLVELAAPSVLLRLVGVHRLTDLAGPEQIYVMAGSGADGSLRGSLDVIPNNLPTQTTSFVGREKEMVELVECLSTARLVTISGAPGIGKTRLAIQAAGEFAPYAPDGVWLVDLTRVTEPELVDDAVMRVLGIGDRANATSTEVIIDYLGTREALMILDNCEHVSEALAALASELISGVEGLRILATSRTPLAVSGEVRVEPRPLGAPESGVKSDLYEAASVRLFADRAASIIPQFRLNGETIGNVADICRKVEGIPLAIEWAARSMGATALPELARELGGYLDTPAGDETADRHRTLSEAMSWSYRTLSENEQALLLSLSVFGGSFETDAVRKIVDPSLAASVRPMLENLCDRSMLVHELAGSSMRYRLLAPVRQYAARLLGESEQASGVQRRYIDWSVSQAQSAYEGLRSRHQSSWLRWLDKELDNLRAGIRMASDVDPPAVASIAGGIWFFWYLRGLLGEAREWLEIAGQINAPPHVRAIVQQGLATVSLNQGDNQRARRASRDAYRICWDTGDLAGMGLSRDIEGLVDRYENNFDQASRMHREALALNRRAANRLQIGISLTFLGLVEFYRGNPGPATGLIESAVKEFRVIGFPWGTCLCLTFLGMSFLAKGRLDQSSTYLQEALNSAREIGHPSLMAESLKGLAALASLGGDESRSARLYEEALRQHERMGEVGRIGECLEHVVHLAGSNDMILEAATLAGAVDALRKQAVYPRAESEQAAHEKLLMSLSEELDDDTMGAALAEGESMSLAQSIQMGVRVCIRLGQEPGGTPSPTREQS